MTDQIGKTIGPYQILEQIGRGGMATVYKAYQPSLERYVAVKILPPHLADRPGFAQRFRREARAVANLEHPHILPVYDHGQEDGLSYLVMRYIESGTLKDQLGQPLELRQTAELIGQIAQALDHAHQQGVIHRDVKPSNVLLDRSDWALLSDFGVAAILEGAETITATGVGVGTPAYMSPEQGEGKKADRRSDVYSLGVVLYEMVTGRVPYQAETPLAVVLMHINDPLPRPRQVNPEVPEGVERVVLKALAKSPEDRYQTAGELAKALWAEIQETEILSVKAEEAEDTQSEDRLTPAERGQAPVKRRLRTIPLLFLGVLLALIGAIGLMRVLRPASSAKSPVAGGESATSPATTALSPSPTATATATPTATTITPARTDTLEPALLPEFDNDDFGDAVVMDELPFSIRLDTNAATLEEGEPEECPLGDPFMQKTVWYRFTPETTMGLIVEGNADFEVAVVVYEGSSLDSLVRQGCIRAGGQWSAPMPTTFFQGKTYYLQLGGALSTNATLTFARSDSEEDSSAPGNDNFADAFVIDVLPFSISLDTRAASLEDGEPQECPLGDPFMQKTVWYRFTPDSTTGLILEANTEFDFAIVVYTGSNLISLKRQGCSRGGGQWGTTPIPTTFFQGTTYYLQLGGTLGTDANLTFERNQ